jgi:type IV secretion system protein VirD4
LLRSSGDGHLLTVGATGSGKTRCAAIPALLEYPGPAVVVDVKGELYRTTAARREALGQRVYCLDAWQLVRAQCDGLNPLDLLRLPGVDPEDAAQSLATMISGGEVVPQIDPFWEDVAHGLNSGLIAYLATSVPEERRRLSYLRQMFAAEFEYRIDQLLKGKEIRSDLARQEFSIFMQHPADKTRPSVQSTAQRHMRLFGNPLLARTLDRSTLSLQALIDGEPLTLYIVFPPDKLESHRSVLRLWLGVILQALSTRRQRPQRPTLLLVDEAAQLGPMEVLRRSVTLLRGYGVRIWTFWQDLSQLRRLYPADWQTLVNNAAVLQLLQPHNLRVAQEYADLVGGFSAEEVLAMEPDEQLLLTDSSRRAWVAQRLDYLRDERFAGLWDPNPMFAGHAPAQIDTPAASQKRR